MDGESPCALMRIGPTSHGLILTQGTNRVDGTPSCTVTMPTDGSTVVMADMMSQALNLTGGKACWVELPAGFRGFFKMNDAE